MNIKENTSWIEKKLLEHFKKNQTLPEYYNPWNDVVIEGIAPTLTVNCGSPCARSGMLIIERENVGHI